MFILGIESSCDETAAAVLVDGRKVLSSTVASQDDVHAAYGGVVPELASRRHIENIVPVVEKALKTAGVSKGDLDAIAVTNGPGLIGSILVGLSFAKSLAFALGKPLVPVNHIEGHLCAVFLEKKVRYPHVGLVISGGHTNLYLVRGFGNYTLLGKTRDDAAGEAFDKVARLLNLGYPGGKAIDKIAPSGDPRSYPLPRVRTKGNELDFSFSGLKTAVSMLVKGEKRPGRWKADIAASFQLAVTEMVAGRVFAGARSAGVKDIVISGGVAANSAIRKRLTEQAVDEGMRVHIPSIGLCTDNAAMIAYAGYMRFMAGVRAGPELNAFSRLIL
jgi:N6-L-threonylcarbamoyladenine synthase